MRGLFVLGTSSIGTHGQKQIPVAIHIVDTIHRKPELVLRHIGQRKHRFVTRIRLPQRRWLLLRNALWTALLRLPWRMALRALVRLLPAIRRQRVTLRILGETLREMPWLLRNRHVIPESVQSMWLAIHGRQRKLFITGSKTGSRVLASISKE